MTAASDLQRAFGERLLVAREAAGLTQRALAQRMRDLGFSWHYTTVQRTEQATRPPRLDEAVVLAALLHIDLMALGTPLAGEVSAARSAWVDAEMQRRCEQAEARAAAAEQRVTALEGAVTRAQRALEPVLYPPGSGAA